MTIISAPSALALWLGRAGLLPFLAGAALAWWARADGSPGLAAHAAQALLAYGAVIVSFLGGLHWGLAMRQAAPQASLLGWGVVPSLLAWPALLLPPAQGLLLLAASLWLCFAVDRRVLKAQGASAWLGLRLQLTLVASLCCGLGSAVM